MAQRRGEGGIDDFRMKNFLNWENIWDIRLEFSPATFGTKIKIKERAEHIKYCRSSEEVRANITVLVVCRVSSWSEMQDPHSPDIFYSNHLLLTECRKMENTQPYSPAPQSTHSDLDAPWCFKVHPSGNSDKAYALRSLRSLVHLFTCSLVHWVNAFLHKAYALGSLGSLIHSFTRSLGH